MWKIIVDWKVETSAMFLINEEEEYAHAGMNRISVYFEVTLFFLYFI
jgi:hypothetical protein